MTGFLILVCVCFVGFIAWKYAKRAFTALRENKALSKPPAKRVYLSGKLFKGYDDSEGSMVPVLAKIAHLHPPDEEACCDFNVIWTGQGGGKPTDVETIFAVSADRVDDVKQAIADAYHGHASIVTTTDLDSRLHAALNSPDIE